MDYSIDMKLHISMLIIFRLCGFRSFCLEDWNFPLEILTFYLYIILGDSCIFTDNFSLDGSSNDIVEMPTESSFCRIL